VRQLQPVMMKQQQQPLADLDILDWAPASRLTTSRSIEVSYSLLLCSFLSSVQDAGGEEARVTVQVEEWDLEATVINKYVGWVSCASVPIPYIAHFLGCNENTSK
jgi:hypothetical protein